MRLAIRAVFLVGVAVQTASADGPGDPTIGEVVAKLQESGCSSIKGLEPLFGPQSYKPGFNFTAPIATSRLAKLGVTKARAVLYIDRYHQDPRKVTDPGIEMLDIDVPDVVIEPALLALPDVKRHDDVIQAGKLYHRRGSNSLTLACRDQPEWARVAWTASSIHEATDKTKLLLDDKGLGLVQVPSDPKTLRLEDDRAVYERKQATVWVKFKTPIPAVPILTALGLTRVTFKADDVHLADWTLHDPAGKRLAYKSRWIEIRLERSMALDIDLGDPPKLVDISKITIDSIWAELK